MNKYAILTAAVLAAVALNGCVQRMIHISSEPAGALVHLNDEEVGRTPLSVPYTFYGTYDVRLEADGYEPMWTMQKTRVPWWEHPGSDLFAEAIPHAKAEQNWHFDMILKPGPEDTAALIDHARQLRALNEEPD